MDDERLYRNGVAYRLTYASGCWECDGCAFVPTDIYEDCLLEASDDRCKRAGLFHIWEEIPCTTH